MDLLWKAVAFVMITAVLVLMLDKQEKDMAVLLSMVACIILTMTACSLLDPILRFLQKVEKIGNLPSDVLKILLKIAGIGITGEITETILSDSKNAALAKCLQFVSAAIILSLSIPIFETFITLLQQILGEL